MRSVLGSVALAATTTAVALAPAPREYRALPATFQIVDAQRHPVAGAVVLMDWSYWESNRHNQRVFLVFETESDSKGEVNVPGWGPLDRPLGAGVKGSTPILRVFKPGYMPFIARQNSGTQFAPPLIRLQWDGQVIELAAADDDSPDYLSRLAFFSGNLPLNRSPDLCWRDSNRKMIEAVNAELHRLQYVGGLIDETDPNESTCGAADNEKG